MKDCELILKWLHQVLYGYYLLFQYSHVNPPLVLRSIPLLSTTHINSPSSILQSVSQVNTMMYWMRIGWDGSGFAVTTQHNYISPQPYSQALYYNRQRISLRKLQEKKNALFCCGLILREECVVVAGFYAKNRMELAGDLKRKFLLQHSSVDIWSVLNLCFDPRFRLICYPFRHYMHRIYMEGKTFALPIFFSLLS